MAAVTYGIVGPAMVAQNSSFIAAVAETQLETDSSTWVRGAPLVITSGLMTEGADPVTAIYALALRPGQNGTSKIATFIPVFGGLGVYANFLTNSGATNILAAGDNGSQFDFHKSTVSSVVLWHASDTTAATSVFMSNFRSDQTPVDRLNGFALASDVDARVSFQWLTDVRAWDT